jgi:hypothetical protein
MVIENGQGAVVAEFKVWMKLEQCWCRFKCSGIRFLVDLRIIADFLEELAVSVFSSLVIQK